MAIKEEGRRHHPRTEVAHGFGRRVGAGVLKRELIVLGERQCSRRLVPLVHHGKHDAGQLRFGFYKGGHHVAQRLTATGRPAAADRTGTAGPRGHP